MRKLILITVTIIGSFTASAQNGIVRVTQPAPAKDLTLEKETEIFTSVEQMPEFPGGTAALMQYLSTNTRYPEAARRDNIQGKVIVQFVVTSTGKIANATIRRDIGAGCGDEALRVVRNMPDWKTGKQNGKSVNVYYTLPMSFRLSDPEPAKESK